jgi:signal transduction histidine kinase
MRIGRQLLRKEGIQQEMLRACLLLSAAVFGTLIIFAVFSWWYHERLLAEARLETKRLSLLLAEQATRTFEAVDFTLRGIEPVLEAKQAPPHDRTIEELLHKRSSELGFVEGIRVLDTQGEEVHQSGSPSGQTNEASRGYFAKLANASPQSLAIGSIEQLDSRRPVIPVARRLSTPEGTFAGVIVADIDPNYFSRFFQDLDLGPGAVVRLTEDSGRVLLASTLPSGGESGSSRTSVVTQPQRVSHLRRLPEDEITANHQTEGYPLAVSVGVGRRELEIRWLRVVVPAAVLLLLVDALVSGLVIVIIRARHERAKARHRAIVAQKLEAMGQMTASVAHDFRNVLAVLTATTRLLRKKGPEEAFFREAEETIERGNAMVEQLLAFSRRQELQLIEADINVVLLRMEGILRHFAGSETELIFDLQDILPRCVIDHTQFDAALMNLVSNSRQAMTGGGRIMFKTELQHQANRRAYVRLTVSDTGSGMDNAALKRVFEPFFTTKATGTGLGLAQVQTFMKQIGGDVAADSAPGSGTSIILRFPIASGGQTTPPLNGDPAGIPPN